MKVVSDSQQLVDFAVRVVNPVLYMPDRQAKFFGKITEELYSVNCNQSYIHQFFFGGVGGRMGGEELVEVTFGLVHVDYTLP